MPSRLHEVLVDMFRVRPEFVAELLSGLLHVDVPAFTEVHLSSGELNHVAPTEYRADLVVTLDRTAGPALAVVVEVQLGCDPAKRGSWPVYVSTLHARLRCPVALLVLAPNEPTARWCAKPILVGHPGFVLTPTVLGPKNVPVVTDVETAVQVLHAFVASVSSIDPKTGNM